MRLNRKTADRGAFDVVVTSMLDINFLLIMFFIMTAQFQIESRAPLELPKETGDENAQPDEAGLVININAAGEIIVSGKTLDLASLRTQVKRQVDQSEKESLGPLKLMLRVDRAADTRDLNSVVTMLRAEGVGTIRMATEVPL
jgi:biopolymer transport protein ExbD